MARTGSLNRMVGGAAPANNPHHWQFQGIDGPSRDWRRELRLYLAPAVRGVIGGLPANTPGLAEEIRVRQDKPLSLRIGREEIYLSPQGQPGSDPRTAYRPTAEDLQQTLQLMSEGSLYAMEEELRSGYLTLPGGYRVGLCGEAVLEAGRIKTLKHITSLNIRLAHQVPGAAGPMLEAVLRRERDRPYQTLLISPPRCGKTTILRDLVRQVSNGVPELGFRGVNVAVVDERSEIAGCYLGVPQNDVGLRTDVLDGCPKAQGMLMLLRSMGPQVIVADEIGREEDILALEEVLNAGITVITTAHARSVEEIYGRPGVSRLLNAGCFERLVVLGMGLGPGTVEAVLDVSGGRPPRFVLQGPLR